MAPRRPLVARATAVPAPMVTGRDVTWRGMATGWQDAMQGILTTRGHASASDVCSTSAMASISVMRLKPVARGVEALADAGPATDGRRITRVCFAHLHPLPRVPRLTVLSPVDDQRVHYRRDVPQQPYPSARACRSRARKRS